MLSRLTTLAIVIAFALVATLIVHAHAIEYTKTFSTSVKVLSSNETFSATGSIGIAFISYPKAYVIVGVTNPGSSTASATVSIDCLNKPSITIDVSGGSTAYAKLELTIPSPPSQYIECTVSVDPPNATSIGIEIYYPTDVSLTFNETHAIYKFDLFTEPYYILGGSNKYFSYFLVYPVYGSPPSGYSIVANLNTTLVTSYTDTAVSENSKSITTSGIALNITDTMPATGRYLGSVTLTMTIPESINLVIMPYYDKFVSSADIVHTKISYVDVLEGETIEIGIINKSTVYNSAGTGYYFNFSYIEIIKKPENLTDILKNNTISSYDIYEISYGKIKNGTVITIYAFVNSSLASNNWIEPVKQSVIVYTRNVNACVKLPKAVIEPGSEFPSIAYSSHAGTYKIEGDYICMIAPVVSTSLAKPVYGLKDNVGEGIWVNVAVLNTIVHSFVLETYYVATVNTTGHKEAYINATPVGMFKDVNVVSTDTTKDMPFINATAYAYYSKVYETSHIVVYAPGVGGGEVDISLAHVVPIEASATVTFKKTATYYKFIVITDKKPNGVDRSVKSESGIGVSKVTTGTYIINVPFDYNYTAFTIDVNALLKILVTWSDGSPAPGINVEVENVMKTITDSNGIAELDPYYGTYHVRAYLVIDTIPIEKATDVVLDDDKSITLTLPIPPPPVKVSEVTLEVEKTEAIVNESITFWVTVKLDKKPDKAIEYGGKLMCIHETGYTPPEKIFTVKFEKGEIEKVIPIQYAFSKPGEWRCKAYVGGVGSNTVKIIVKSPGAAAAASIGEFFTQYGIYILLIILLIVIIVLIVAAFRKRKTITVYF